VKFECVASCGTARCRTAP